MLLAIDTSAGTSVAVVQGDRVLAQRSVEDSRRHAEVIGALVRDCLSDAGDPALTGVVAGMGPGPFTGLRVGIAAAQAFAFARDLPLWRLGSHEALAADWYAAERHAAAESAGPLLVTTDARRRELYWTAYRGLDDAGAPVIAHGPALDRPDDLPTAVTDYDSYQRIDADWVSAGALGLLAERMLAAGRDFTATEPLYLRAPDAVPAATTKRVTA